MTSFNGRRDLNSYSNISNLNTLPSDYELAMQQQQQHLQQQSHQHGPHQESYNMTSDLDLFTNAQFFDFDMGDNMPLQSPTTLSENDPFPIHKSSMSYFEDYPTVYSNHSSKIGTPLVNPHTPHNASHYALPTRNAIAPPLHSHISSHSQQPSQLPSTQASPSISASTTPAAIDKRKFDNLIDAAIDDTHEEAARVAAEEDKRRRNTAASARFRVKKKQREALLEKNAKDMSDKLTYLENRVTQLELENKLLKDLITEKSGKEVNMAELVRDMGREVMDGVEISGSKKGVGTGFASRRASVKTEA